jgi:co-chaperonin GroES (HSP10)
MAQVTPKGDLVLAKVAEAEEATTGGILLPTSAQRKPTSGARATLPASLGRLGQRTRSLRSKLSCQTAPT